MARLSNESELTQDDRRKLDDAVLRMMGIRTKKERTEILDRLYLYLFDFFEAIRRKEELAIINKNRSRRGKTSRSAEIARELLKKIDTEYGSILRTYHDFIDYDKPFSTYEVPIEGEPETRDNLLETNAIAFTHKGQLLATIYPRSEEQQRLVFLLAQNGLREFIKVPYEAHVAAELYDRYSAFLTERAQMVRTLIEDRTADPDLQEKLFKAIMKELSAH